MTLSERFEWTCLTPGDGHFCFGYYDRCAWDAAGRYHLALRIPQQKRLPEPGETADVGVVERGAPGFQRLATTQAWCHQQGAMTLWLPRRPGCFVYNDFVPEANGAWRPVAQVFDLGARALVGQFDRPIYAISPDGRWGASLNFSRIPRRGYSYARATLTTTPPDLDGDGLFVVDLETGKSHLAAPYRRLLGAHPLPYDLLQDAGAIWLNHAIFNADSSRVMVLLRTCADPAKPWPWHTHMFTMRLDGTELDCPLPHALWRESAISHQMWGRTPGEILIDANWCGRGHEYVVFDSLRHPFQAHRISRGMGPMGHLVFSPDGRWLAADTYAIEGIQRLALVRVDDGTITELGQFRHRAESDVGDVRCDLHPRWSRDGRTLTVDSIHDGARRIYALDVSSITAGSPTRCPGAGAGAESACRQALSRTTAHVECAALDALSPPPPEAGASLRSRSSAVWPHAPDNWLFTPGNYFVTVGILHKEHLLHRPERLSLVRDSLFEVAAEFGWQLRAWAVLANHYHFVARSPSDPSTLRAMLAKLHSCSARTLNRQDAAPGRKVWHRFMSTPLTFEPSLLARLQYTHANPQRHGVVADARTYEWCSASWFERSAPRAFVKAVMGAKSDAIVDEF